MTAVLDLKKGKIQKLSVTTSGINIATVAGKAGQQFVLKIVQGVTGHTVTFDPTYIGLPAIPATPLTYSSLPLEIDDSGNAVLYAAPVLGVSSTAPFSFAGNIKIRANVAGAPLFITSPTTPTDGRVVTVIILQDATGFQVTWDTPFAMVTANTVPKTPLMTSTITFMGDTATGLWFPTSEILGRKA